VVWLDGLDIPTLRFFDAGFAEHGKELSQSTSLPEGDSLHRYGSNLVPVDFYQTSTEPTKVVVYPFAQTREALEGISKVPADAWFGHKLRFVNPATGSSPMPTIGAFAQRLDAGCKTRPYRCTDGTVYVCLEGGGTADIEGQEFHFVQNDVFVVPSWHTLQLRARSETILFSLSDRPAQQALGIWREEKIN